MRPGGEKSVSLHLHVMQCQLGLSSSVPPSACPTVSFFLRANLSFSVSPSSSTQPREGSSPRSTRSLLLACLLARGLRHRRTPGPKAYPIRLAVQMSERPVRGMSDHTFPDCTCKPRPPRTALLNHATSSFLRTSSPAKVPRKPQSLQSSWSRELGVGEAASPAVAPCTVSVSWARARSTSGRTGRCSRR